MLGWDVGHEGAGEQAARGATEVLGVLRVLWISSVLRGAGGKGSYRWDGSPEGAGGSEGWDGRMLRVLGPGGSGGSESPVGAGG